MPGYVTGGAVPTDSDAYISRRFEDAAYAELTAGNWVVLLAPRQQGKTSALVRLRKRLRDDGFTCTIVDFQAYAGEASYAEFLDWFCDRVARELGLEPVEPARGREDVESRLDEVLLGLPNVVLVYDEVSAVPATHQRRFFSQLRALHNRRAMDDADALSRRVQMAFAGTFRPERLIDSPNSPFYVSRELLVDDLDLEQVRSLADRLSGPELVPYADRVMDLVAGQPYLTQTLLAAADRGVDADDREARFTHAARALKEERNPHVTYLFELVRSDPALVQIVENLLNRPDGVPYRVGNPDHDFANVCGIAVLREGRLFFRNALYASLASVVFGASERGEGTSELETAPPSVDVLLVTATAVETAAVRRYFLGEGASPPPRIFGRANSYLDLGVANGLTVAHVQIPSMGSTGAGGSTLTAHDAIQELQPSRVIMTGIAFGVDSESQRVGDVFVSQQIMGYELQRVGEDKLIPRGERVSASAALLGLFQSAFHDWETHRVEFGLVLSGEKLVDREDFRDQLKELEPEAIGGEMEAIGLQGAAARSNTDWIAVKACCDFADGRKSENKNENQRVAADAAAGLVHFALNLEGRRL